MAPVHAPRAPRRWLDRRCFLRGSLRAVAGLAALPLTTLPLAAACQSPAGQFVGEVLPVGEPAPAFPTPLPDAPVVIVEMMEMRFDPVHVTIPSGAVVRWVNASRFAHTATGDPAVALDPTHAILPEGVPAWDSGLVLPGQRWGRMFTVPGDYSYFCLPHEDAGMIGTIEVTA